VVILPAFASSAHFKSSSDESDLVETTEISAQERSKAGVLGITAGRLRLLDYGFKLKPDILCLLDRASLR